MILKGIGNNYCWSPSNSKTNETRTWKKKNKNTTTSKHSSVQTFLPGSNNCLVKYAVYLLHKNTPRCYNLNVLLTVLFNEN